MQPSYAVNISISTAMNKFDYTNIFFTGTFGSGSEDGSQDCANISILDDLKLEVSKMFNVRMSTPDLDIDLKNDETSVIIIDDDS